MAVKNDRGFIVIVVVGTWKNTFLLLSDVD
jgi:hypothetical protein